MNTNIAAALNQMSKEELTQLILDLGMDRAFGIISRNMAETFYTTIEADKTLIMVDIANMHALNHAFTMAGADERIKNVTDVIRHSDLVVRWGGDEIVIVLNSGNVAEYIIRLNELMAANDLYAVICAVNTSNSLVETVNRADEKISATKLMLEVTGQKPDRNAPYVCLNSVIIGE